MNILSIYQYQPRKEYHKTFNDNPHTSYKAPGYSGFHQIVTELEAIGFLPHDTVTTLPTLSTPPVMNRLYYIPDTGHVAGGPLKDDAQLVRFDGLAYQDMTNPTTGPAQWAAYFAIASGAVLGRHIEVPLTASTGTTVLHSFGAYPQVSFVQANGDELGAFGKTHDSQNQITVAFNAPVTGTLVLDLGSTAVAPAILVVSPPMTTI
jgi:hypothetical protein